MDNESRQREIKKCRELLERKKLNCSQKHNLEVYLHSLEKERN